MRFTSQTSSDGVTEQFFTLDEIPGVLWTPEGACGTRPLILLGHGGRQHKPAPSTVSRARRYAAEGFAVVAIDAPNHGDRPKDEEFGRIAAEMRAGMAAGENPGALVAGMHSYLAGQAEALPVMSKRRRRLAIHFGWKRRSGGRWWPPGHEASPGARTLGG